MSQVKVVGTTTATATLAEYTAEIESGPVIITKEGKPVAALVPIDNADLESVALGANREFLDLIERSRARAKAEGGIPNDEMRRRFE